MSVKNLEGAELGFVLDRSSNTMEMPETVVTDPDRQLLRELGSRVAEIGSMPIQAERKSRWTRLNGLNADRSR